MKLRRGKVILFAMNVDDLIVNKDQFPEPLPNLGVAQRIYILSILLQKAQHQLRTVDVHAQTYGVHNPLGSSGRVLNHIAILLSRGTPADADLTVATLITPLRLLTGVICSSRTRGQVSVRATLLHCS